MMTDTELAAFVKWHEAECGLDDCSCREAWLVAVEYAQAALPNSGQCSGKRRCQVAMIVKANENLYSKEEFPFLEFDLLTQDIEKVAAFREIRRLRADNERLTKERALAMKVVEAAEKYKLEADAIISGELHQDWADFYGCLWDMQSELEDTISAFRKLEEAAAVRE